MKEHASVHKTAILSNLHICCYYASFHYLVNIFEKVTNKGNEEKVRHFGCKGENTFQNVGKIKQFSDEEKLREYATVSPALKGSSLDKK